MRQTLTVFRDERGVVCQASTADETTSPSATEDVTLIFCLEGDLAAPSFQHKVLQTASRHGVPLELVRSRFITSD